MPVWRPSTSKLEFDQSDPLLIRLEALGIQSPSELRERLRTATGVGLMGAYLDLPERRLAALAEVEPTRLVTENLLARRPLAKRKRGALVPAGQPKKRKATTPLDDMEQDLLGLGLVARRNPAAAAPVVHTSLLTPVRDQGERGTCVAFACAAALEGFRIASGGPKKDDRSEQFVYWSAKERDGYADEEGTFVESAMQGLVHDGVCHEGTWQYVPTHDPDNEGQGPPTKTAVKEAARNTIAVATSISAKAVGNMKRTMQTGRLIALSVHTWPFWDELPAKKTGKLGLPIPGEDADGAHAVCLVGYVDDPKRPGGGDFVFKNSWGTGWGKNGFGFLPYRYVKLYGLEAYFVAS